MRFARFKAAKHMGLEGLLDAARSDELSDSDRRRILVCQIQESYDAKDRLVELLVWFV